MYLDTSVLVKLFVTEPDSEECERIIAGDKIVSSELLYAEMQGALLAKEREGRLRPLDRQRIADDFENAITESEITLVKLDSMTVREAVALMRQVYPIPLRTLDAIHLATYMSVDAGPLFTRDRRMLDAARKLGLPLAG